MTSARLRLQRIAGLVVVLAALALGWRIHRHINRSNRLQAELLSRCNAETARAASALEDKLRPLMQLTDSLAADIAASRIPDGEISRRLAEALRGTPDIFQLGVAFAPGARPGPRLFAPFASRSATGIESYQLEDRYDYSTADWYRESMAAEGWGPPHLSKATGAMVIGYAVCIRPAGQPGAAPLGMVRLNLSMDGIGKIVSNVSLGRTGYGFLVSDKGVYLADPVAEYVRRQRTILEVAAEHHDSARQRLGQMVLRGERGFVEGTSSVTGQPTFIFLAPIPTVRWSLGAVFIKDELGSGAQEIRRSLIHIAGAALVLLAALAFLGLRIHETASLEHLQPLWRYVAVLSGLFLSGVCFLWYLTLNYADPISTDGRGMVQITDQAGLRTFLEREGRLSSHLSEVTAVPVPTGVFVETLRFGTQGEALVTGHLWQKVSASLPQGFRPGVLFPDAESSEQKEVLRRREGDHDVVILSFKASLRLRGEQAFRYPFDRLSVAIRMWPIDFPSNQILTPDLDAYQVLNPTTLPGVERSLRVPGWRPNGSYYSYSLESYNSNFGLEGYVGQQHSPELNFNVELQRRFLDPFISSVLPVIVVSGLLFMLLLVTTKSKDKVAATGFKGTDILRAVITLLFPVIYAQISLRSRIVATGVIYVEYLYFVMYAILLLVGVNTLAFTSGKSRFTETGDNALPKLLYWPIVLGLFFAISLTFLY